MKDFWSKLNKPIIALAPMAGVADSAFRQVCKKYGANVVYSEMASVAALSYGSHKTLELLKFSKVERPYVVQLFGNKPEQFAKAVKVVEREIKPDGFDINFGCPVNKVIKQGAGAILMSDVARARTVVEAVIESSNLPLSIKTRTKVRDVHLFEFLKKIKHLQVKSLMIHGRTLAQGFGGEIDYSTIKEAKKYFKGLIIANGGIASRADADKMLKNTNADGVGIARGALGRPWIFSEFKNEEFIEPAMRDKIKAVQEHAEIAFKLKGEAGIREMRKHLCWYVAGFPEASKIRNELAKVESLDEIKNILGL